MLILLDKPLGITSAKALEPIKRALGAKKAGHAGTLDPLATGLLIVATNADTKKLAEYLKLPKTYEAEILFGKRTDTGDLEGKVLEEKAVGDISDDDLKRALADMRGTLELPTPAYSALKKEGVPLYKRIRRGEAVEPPIRAMEVLSAELIEFHLSGGGPAAKVRFDVGSGTYIRSLAEELGRRLGYPATLAGLRRTRIGNFDIQDAKTIEQIEKAG